MLYVENSIIPVPIITMVKFVSYNCNSIRNNVEIVKSLFEKADVIFLQEIMLSKSDLPLLNDFNEQFQYTAFVKI